MNDELLAFYQRVEPALAETIVTDQPERAQLLYDDTKSELAHITNDDGSLNIERLAYVMSMALSLSLDVKVGLDVVMDALAGDGK